ncbi:MAG: glycosyltransferase, partial [Candidatus Pacebacteria bacterium]|nr:glycosyltransferase [Candidatus Paceibacterota bacterium]
EAMACGTPVIASNRGSVSEVIKHGKTGFVTKNEKEMIKAIKNIEKIKREDCRFYVEENFTIEKMVDNYEKVYRKIIKNR